MASQGKLEGTGGVVLIQMLFGCLLIGVAGGVAGFPWMTSGLISAGACMIAYGVRRQK